MLGLLKVAT